MGFGVKYSTTHQPLVSFLIYWWCCKWKSVL